ncbi:MAG: 4Fe-4S binding protein [Bacteroidales bacterium]|jgi:polyferredoxin|nr:4Fe-4S binding protein [Bacteroidales bacterium]
MQKTLKTLVHSRFIILAIIGISTYVAVSYFNVSLWYILLIGVVLGIIFGKVFCRWGCPMGLIMEIMMSLSGSGKMRQMYQYHKIGCPIAWISGWLNKFSLFRIQLKTESCKTCGICDKACYIVSMEPIKYSLYKSQKERPGDSYTCSKCLKCVVECPNGSLQFKM